MTYSESSPRLSGELPNRCWFRIGVWGSGACEDLNRFVHCFNCPVYQRAGKDLFGRAPSPEYTSRMSEVLRKPFEIPDASQESFLVFILRGEYFALSSHVVRAVTPFSGIHSVPFRSGSLFLGLSPVRGKLRLCYSLSEALHQECLPASGDDLRRLLLVGPPESSFVFPVSEVEGLVAIPEGSIKLKTPSCGSEFTLGFATLEGKDVHVLSGDSVVAAFSNKQL